MSNLTERVKQPVKFVMYRDGSLWYETFDGWQYEVPAEEAKGGTFLPEDKGIYHMRFMRKFAEKIEKERQKQTKQ